MPERISMNVSVTRRLARFIQARVKSGRYQSASEVVRDGLRALEERESDHAGDLEAVRAKIAAGLEQLKRGQTVDGRQAFRKLRERNQTYRAGRG